MALALAHPDTGPGVGAAARSAAPTSPTLDVVAVNFVGSNPNARFIGASELPSRSNYFLPSSGGEESGVRNLRDIPNYGRVQAANVYDDVDLAYYSNQQGKLEFDFIVQPGASAQPVQLEIQGAQNLSTDAAGNLLIETASGGRLTYEKPVLYQDADGVRQTIRGSYALLGDNRV